MHCRVPFIYLVVILSLIVLSGCGGSTPTQSSSNPVALPKVVSSVPPNAATGVPINYSVAVTFDQPMDPATLTSKSFKISAVDGAVEYDATNRTAVFHASSAFAGSTAYIVTITTDVKSTSGMHLLEPYSFNFLTATVPDTMPPTVTAVFPTPGATNVPLSTIVTATFSEAMDPTGLIGQTSTGISGSLLYDSSAHKASLTPTDKLVPNTVYTVTIKGSVKDLAGNQMGADYVWTFTTGPQ